jgi:Cu+-exporting ATPase
MRPNELMDVAAALALSRTIFTRIKLNLAWACMYNVVGLPIAMGFFLPLGWHLHPMMAGFAMASSSVTVVVSSLLLKFWQRPAWMADGAAPAVVRRPDGTTTLDRPTGVVAETLAGLRGAVRDLGMLVRAALPGGRGDAGAYVPLRDLSGEEEEENDEDEDEMRPSERVLTEVFGVEGP